MIYEWQIIMLAGFAVGFLAGWAFTAVRYRLGRGVRAFRRKP
jgi:hypothetical protein